MNENTTAAETATQENAASSKEVKAEQETVQKEFVPKEKAPEMPKEERSLQAARRRAAEQKNRILETEQREAQLREQLLSHPLVKEAVGLIEETRFKKDLEQVRSVYPNLTAKSPIEVGEIYCRLMASGHVDPVVAYEAQAAADRRTNPVPENMVSAKSAGGAALYYSSRELDRLTEQDLKDPAIFQKALASLSKLRS